YIGDWSSDVCSSDLTTEWRRTVTEGKLLPLAVGAGSICTAASQSSGIGISIVLSLIVTSLNERGHSVSGLDRDDMWLRYTSGPTDPMGKGRQTSRIRGRWISESIPPKVAEKTVEYRRNPSLFPELAQR